MALLELWDEDFHSILFLFLCLERSLSLILLNPLFKFLFLSFLNLFFFKSFLKFTIIVLPQFGSSLLPLHLFHLHLFLLHVVQFLSSGWHVHFVLSFFLFSSILNLLNEILGLFCSWVVDAEVTMVDCCLHFPSPVFDPAFDVDLVKILLQRTNFVLDHTLFNFDHAIGISSFHIFKFIFVLRNPLKWHNFYPVKSWCTSILDIFLDHGLSPTNSFINFLHYFKNTSLIYRFFPDF